MTSDKTPIDIDPGYPDEIYAWAENMPEDTQELVKRLRQIKMPRHAGFTVKVFLDTDFPRKRYIRLNTPDVVTEYDVILEEDSTLDNLVYKLVQRFPSKWHGDPRLITILVFGDHQIVAKKTPPVSLKWAPILFRLYLSPSKKFHTTVSSLLGIEPRSYQDNKLAEFADKLEEFVDMPGLQNDTDALSRLYEMLVFYYDKYLYWLEYTADIRNASIPMMFNRRETSPAGIRNVYHALWQWDGGINWGENASTSEIEDDIIKQGIDELSSLARNYPNDTVSVRVTSSDPISTLDKTISKTGKGSIST